MTTTAVTTESVIRNSDAYKEFRSQVALRKVCVGRQEKEWQYYDMGPRDMIPVVMVHGTCSDADVYFYQIMALSSRGYRVISARFPPYWSHADWIRGFNLFLTELKVLRFHLFASSLGGFLSLQYTTVYPDKVLSLVLCNTFVDSTLYHKNAPWISMFPFMPEFYLKKYVLDNFPEHVPSLAIANAIDFAVYQLELLTADDVASRLTLNCLKHRITDMNGYDDSKVTLLDTVDISSFPAMMREQVYKLLPNAKQALLKEGGDFPFLAVPEEVNLHVELHLRRQNLFPAGEPLAECDDARPGEADPDTGTDHAPESLIDSKASYFIRHHSPNTTELGAKVPPTSTSEEDILHRVSRSQSSTSQSESKDNLSGVLEAAEAAEAAPVDQAPPSPEAFDHSSLVEDVLGMSADPSADLQDTAEEQHSAEAPSPTAPSEQADPGQPMTDPVESIDTAGKDGVADDVGVEAPAPAEEDDAAEPAEAVAEESDEAKTEQHANGDTIPADPAASGHDGDQPKGKRSRKSKRKKKRK